MYTCRTPRVSDKQVGLKQIWPTTWTDRRAIVIALKNPVRTGGEKEASDRRPEQLRAEGGDEHAPESRFRNRRRATTSKTQRRLPERELTEPAHEQHGRRGHMLRADASAGMVNQGEQR